MDFTFPEFVTIIRDSEQKGIIKTTVPMTDFDLAVQYAIGLIGEKRGYPCDITIDEIHEEMLKFAPDLILREVTHEHEDSESDLY